MNKKLLSLLALSTLSIVGLTACGSKEETTEEPKTEQSTDAFTGATAGTNSFEVLSKGLSEKGSWITAATKDISAPDKEIDVEGTFKNKAGDEARKLALYTQDADKKITERFTLTVKKLKVNSPHFYISNGTVKGDVEVEAEGFYGQTGQGVPREATIDGNLIFKNKELMDNYNQLPKEDKVKVTGEIRVK